MAVYQIKSKFIKMHQTKRDERIQPFNFYESLDQITSLSASLDICQRKARRKTIVEWQNLTFLDKMKLFINTLQYLGSGYSSKMETLGVFPTVSHCYA